MYGPYSLGHYSAILLLNRNLIYDYLKNNAFQTQVICMVTVSWLGYFGEINS